MLHSPIELLLLLQAAKRQNQFSIRGNQRNLATVRVNIWHEVIRADYNLENKMKSVKNLGESEEDMGLEVVENE